MSLIAEDNFAQKIAINMMAINKVAAVSIVYRFQFLKFYA